MTNAALKIIASDAKQDETLSAFQWERVIVNW